MSCNGVIKGHGTIEELAGCSLTETQLDYVVEEFKKAKIIENDTSSYDWLPGDNYDNEDIFFKILSDAKDKYSDDVLTMAEILSELNDCTIDCVSQSLRDDNPVNNTGWRANVSGFTTSEDGYASLIFLKNGDELSYDSEEDEWSEREET
jgi:hypothetical protein